MDDDGFLKDVEKAFADCIREGMKWPEDELWEFAKKRAKRRHFLDYAAELERQGGGDYFKIVGQYDDDQRAQEKLKKDLLRNN